MTTFTVQTGCGTAREFDSRRDAEAGVETHVSLCEECEESDVTVRAIDPQQTSLADAGTSAPSVHAAGAPADEGGATAAAGTASTVGDRPAPAEDLPADLPGSVTTDPLDVVPGYMIDEVEGQPTINKRGYAVIANHFDIVVAAEPITTAGETDHEYAEFRAKAWRKEDGPEHAYTGHATARASEDRRGIEDNLNEMAETRAMKRAVAWASGVGILAWEEMAGYLDE